MLERANHDWNLFERQMLDAAGDDLKDEVNELLDVLPSVSDQIQRRAERSAKRQELHRNLANFFDANKYRDEGDALTALRAFCKSPRLSARACLDPVH